MDTNKIYQADQQAQDAAFNLGMGKKYWKEMNWNMDLPEKESDDIWENAFRYMAEGKI